MNGSLVENAKRIEQLKVQAKDFDQVDVCVCPPYPYLSQVNELLATTPIQVGAQNASAENAGANTGEISVSMLKEFGCAYVLLGHSERRSLFQEDDRQIAAKCETALTVGLTPVVCVGETLEERQQGITESVISVQVEAVLEQVGINGLAKVVIAYEPVWAIGTGETATPKQAQSVHAHIRGLLAECSPEVANTVPIIYGGSVKPDNARALFRQEDVDGGLVGGASLDADAFVQVCRAAC